MLKKIIHLKLKILAKLILVKYKPKIIGITGSVGKTSTKEAVYTVLKTSFQVRQSKKNYNNEIGLPLTIIGVSSPGKSIFGWGRVFFQALKLIIFKNKKYTKILILEMGIDRVGDMEYLLSIAQPQIGIVTRIGESHLEFFQNVDEIKKEKLNLVKNITKTGWIFLNQDDPKLADYKNNHKNILTYGLTQDANLQAINIINFDNFQAKKTDLNKIGISFQVKYKNKIQDVHIKNTIGLAVVYASLVSFAVGIVHNIDLKTIANSLAKLKSPVGRMKIISGIKYTLIIDDTYNSSPQSVEMALDSIKKINLEAGRSKFIVLGDMLELGGYSRKGHEKIGQRVAEYNFDKLIIVGKKSRDIVYGAKKAGMNKNNISHFMDNDQAGKFLQKIIKQGDLILIKGSQGMRMEKIVKEIMSEPLRAKELLVRQDNSWD